MSILGQRATLAGTAQGEGSDLSWPQLAARSLASVASAGASRRNITWYALAVGCGVLASGCGVGLVATSAWLIARAAEHPPILTLLVAIVAVRAFGIGRGVFCYLERLIGHDAALRWLARLRARIYERIAAQTTEGRLAHRDHVDTRQRLVRDVDAVPDVALRVLLPAIITVVIAAGTTAVVAALAPMAGLIVCGAVLVALVGVPWLTQRVSARAEARIVADRAELAATTERFCAELPELVSYDADGPALEELAQIDRRLRRAELRSVWSQGLGSALVLACVGVACWGAAAAGIDAVVAGTLSSAGLAVVVLTPLALADVLSALPTISGLGARSKRALDRVIGVCQGPAVATASAPNAARTYPSKSSRSTQPSAAGSTGSTGSSEFVAASAGTRRAIGEPRLRPPYDVDVSGLAARWSDTVDAPEDVGIAEGSATGEPADVFTGLSFSLPAGHRLAVLGESGTGKSTLAQVMVGFLPPSRGSVRIAGVDTAELSGEQLRSIVGLCTQSAYVFDTTIAENIRLARPDADDAQVRDVLERVRLLDWVRTLPSGMDTPVGEHGNRLSGGERQRLALARCLLAATPVVVLDEPTEHLDDLTATPITADLLNASSGRSVLLITHRCADLALVDDVVWLPASHKRG